MEPLTRRQSRVLTFIRKHIKAKGYPPTWKEVAHSIGSRNPNTGTTHLRALAKKGYIKWETGKARAIKILYKANGGKT